MEDPIKNKDVFLALIYIRLIEKKAALNYIEKFPYNKDFHHGCGIVEAEIKALEKAKEELS